MGFGFVQPMKTCQYCQSRIREQAQFCTQCGRFITFPNKLICTQCGKQAEDRADRFCEACGTSLTKPMLMPKVSVRPGIIPPRPIRLRSQHKEEIR